ncbi:MauE/DoxX family redox-associated membrane protein [Actinomadura rudentiformis]|uniref:Methylamine utilisation protein MauE domain-containing protein n=1 Tax=Actinomadura rudentiformis TaxID=359158 RepID=A0A6H9YWU6_9ACTN|nr:MauE/DoxX family redox-associated membrane protein [Actinomadura rudentiformis]KAB2349408.1 hypothetical protein F8566_11455 [Actinomadura rudentiformis]
MNDLLAVVALVTVPLVLLGSLAGHVARPGVLVTALRAHRTVPGAMVVGVARLVGVTEALLLGEMIVALIWWEPGLLRAGMATAAALLAVYGLYSAYVRWRRPPGVPCGCAGIETPMTGWVTVRAALLGLIAVAGAVYGPVEELQPFQIFIGSFAGLVFTVIASILPEAMIYVGGADQ